MGVNWQCRGIVGVNLEHHNLACPRSRVSYDDDANLRDVDISISGGSVQRESHFFIAVSSESPTRDQHDR